MLNFPDDGEGERGGEGVTMPGDPFGKRRQANLEEKEGNCRRGGLSAAESGLPH